MEIVYCSSHNKPCLLKTGLKEGPNFGKSFYICSSRSGPCKFVKEASDYFPVYCPQHSGQLLELQALNRTTSASSAKHYYRCKKGYSDTKQWCGFWISEHKICSPQPLSERDVNCVQPENLLKPKKKSEQSNTPPNHTECVSNTPPNHTECVSKYSNIPEKDCRTSSVMENSKTALAKGPSKPSTKPKKTSSSSKEDAKESSSGETAPRSLAEKKTLSFGSLSRAAASASPPRHPTVSAFRAEAKMSINDSFSYRNTSTVEMASDDEDGGVSDDGGEDEKQPEVDMSVSDVFANSPAPKPETKGTNRSPNDQRDHSHSDNDALNIVEDSSDEESQARSCARDTVEIKDSSGDEGVSTTPVREDQKDSDEEDCVITREEPSPQNTQREAQQAAAENGAKPKQTLVQAGSNNSMKVIRPDGSSYITQMLVKEKVPASNPAQQSESKTIKVIRSDGSTFMVKLPANSVLPTAQSVATDPRKLKSELVRNVQEKERLARNLENQKKLLGTVNLDALPDCGQRLRRQVEELSQQVVFLDLTINKQLRVLKSCPPVPDNATASSSENQPIKIVSQTQHKPDASMGTNVVYQPTASGQLIPVTVRQTKITEHANSAPLPDHVLRQMYAAQPQMQSLYGGRMTQARLREVGSVTAEAIERLHRQLESMPKEEAEVTDPEGLTVPLMPHQRRALAWLAWREGQHPPGGILADDMGLGKTLTMISHIASRRESDRSTRKKGEEDWLSTKMSGSVVKSSATLVVCPASLVHQWDREIKKRCYPNLFSVVLYHGTDRPRDIHKLADADVVLTTYNIISREVALPDDAKKDKAAAEMPATDGVSESGSQDWREPMLLRIAWHRIILDEAHNIKNHKSATALSACRLRALYRWALTGTPIQNNLLDMYSLLRFLRCSPFDEFKVWKCQVDNKSATGTKRLNTLVKSLLLRRTKTQTGSSGKPLVSLPDKNVISHDLTLSRHERLVYDRVFQQSQSVLENYLETREQRAQQTGGASRNMSSQPMTSSQHVSSSQSGVAASQSNPWAGARPVGTQSMGAEGGGTHNGGGQILLLLLRLRQCCSHPGLMKDALDMDALQADGLDQDIVDQMLDMSIREQAPLNEPSVTDVLLPGTASSKIKAVLEELEKIRNDSDKKNPMKSVVVSQWTGMLKIVDRHLRESGFRTCIIKGNVTAKTRADLVDAFNGDPTGPEVMLLSLRAGGVGLNLVGGNHLFLIDMHWNPALEQQACDRVYRMGQKREVFIHRFVCRDTVEEKILKLQEQKLKLAENILTGAGASANKLTLDDLRMLFGLNQPASFAAAGPTDYSGIAGAHPGAYSGISSARLGVPALYPSSHVGSHAARAPFKPPTFIAPR